MWQGDRDEELDDGFVHTACGGGVGTNVRDGFGGDDRGDGRATGVTRAPHVDQAAHEPFCPIATQAFHHANVITGFRPRHPTVRAAASHRATDPAGRRVASTTLHGGHNWTEGARTGLAGRHIPPTTFHVLGDPIPQPRPRVSTLGGFAKAYVPAKHPVHEFRPRVAHAARDAGLNPRSGPVSVEIAATFRRPRSHLNKSGVKRSAPTLLRPDVDNVAKGMLDAILDALGDDTRVAKLTIEKAWGSEGCTTVTMTTGHDDGGGNR